MHAVLILIIALKWTFGVALAALLLAWIFEFKFAAK
jgi:hypothetical protein